MQLMPESLFLTINLIDRYLAKRQVTRKNLQLVRPRLTHDALPCVWLCVLVCARGEEGGVTA